MYISLAMVVFFVIAIFIAGLMVGCVLVAGKETEPGKTPTKVIRISEDIESSIVHPNVPEWKKTVEN